MAIRTHQSISGFVASDPQLSYTDRGDARLYVKVGIEHYRKEPDNTFTQLETGARLLLRAQRPAVRGRGVHRDAHRTRPRPHPLRGGSQRTHFRPRRRGVHRTSAGRAVHRGCHRNVSDPAMSDQFHPEHDDMPPEAGLASPRFDVPEPPHPVNWNLLTANDLEAELLELNRWVDWLRHTYGLPASVVPPYWHRHPELLWELSALHLHWLCAYDPEQNGSAPLGWHRDFADARARLRDWVSACGTRLDRDRPTRQTSWPGEDPTQPIEDSPITDRDEDFVRFVIDMVDARQEAEDAFFAGIDPETGEV